MDVLTVSPQEKLQLELHSAGTLLLSNLFNAAGFGILTVQVYFFFLAFTDESRKTKCLVYGVYVLELAQTVELSRTMFHLFVQSFLEQASLNNIYDLWFSVPIMGGIVACVVQLFYVWRVYKLRGVIQNPTISRIVVVAGTVLSIGQLASSIALGIQMSRLKVFTEIKTTQIEWSVGGWLSGEAICDIMIAACMTYIFRNSLGEAMDDTRVRAKRFIKLTIETGTLTGMTYLSWFTFQFIMGYPTLMPLVAAVAVVNIVLILYNGQKLYYQTSVTEVSKLYSNTLLLSLNVRMKLDYEGGSEQDENRALTTLKFDNDARTVTESGGEISQFTQNGP
ncbi:hypothetical protein D9613_008130 [Agrocybe pediades]|uniref:DUF6534 domain-containing protein n=1 Tax=Agrocybe pediades TaxID=84607 RepID=A0A8H4QLR0_9AGAR|nr:hypothetical protein D9613_008130 [Agrocybe pediades]